MTIRIPMSLAAVALSLAAVPFAGCRTVAGLVGDKDAEARGNARWAVSMPDYESVPDPEDKTVYMTFKNPSGADVDTHSLRDRISAGLRANDWKIVRRPSEARYKLEFQLHYWGENVNADKGASGLRWASTAIGAAGGAAVGAGVGDGDWGNIAIGGVAGGVGGYAIGTAIENHSKVTEWNMIVEMRVIEQLPEGLEVQVARNERQAKAAGHGVAAGAGDGGGVAGATANRSSRTQRYVTSRDSFRYRNVLVAYARQIRMAEDEAMDYLLPKLERAFPEVLPG